jgi:hypothetical protein
VLKMMARTGKASSRRRWQGSRGQNERDGDNRKVRKVRESEVTVWIWQTTTCEVGVVRGRQ